LHTSNPFFFQAEDGIRYKLVTGVQTFALPIFAFVGDILPQRQRDLYVMRVDGSDKKQLTRGSNVWFASWSPDGKRLAVTTERSEIGRASCREREKVWRHAKAFEKKKRNK